MTKILHVGGEDYAALDFERARDAGKVDPKVLWGQAVDSEESLVWDDGEAYFEYDALLFEDIDPDFIEYVKAELIDYDDGKSCNIYVVGD